MPVGGRKQDLLATVERLGPKINGWRQRNRYFHEEDARYMRFLVPPGLRVLELGCGTGWLLDRVQPKEGIGVDFSPTMIEIARARYPHLEFVVGDVEDRSVIDSLTGAPFDAIVLSDTIGALEDVQNTFAQLHPLCAADTRIIVAYRSGLWYPVLRLAELLSLKMPALSENSLSTDDIGAILALAGFEEVKREWRQLLPKWWLGLGPLVNRFVATLPLVRRLCLRNYIVLRSSRMSGSADRSATIVIPCRNERGNIEAAVRRIPNFAPDQEIIFVEGHSKDGTLDEIHRVMARYPNLDIKAAVQEGRGKGDAVRKGFDLARGDVLMILDADLTMPPEELPKFYEVIASGRGEFVFGSRLVYPMEDQAMRFLNLVANRILRLRLQLSVEPTLNRHPVWHQGAPQAALSANRGGTGLLRGFRSIRRLRSDLRGNQIEPYVRGSTNSLYGSDLRRDADLSLSARLAAAAYGRICLVEAQGDLREPPAQGRGVGPLTAPRPPAPRSAMVIAKQRRVGARRGRHMRVLGPSPSAA